MAVGIVVLGMLSPQELEVMDLSHQDHQEYLEYLDLSHQEGAHQTPLVPSPLVLPLVAQEQEDQEHLDHLEQHPLLQPLPL